MARRMIGAVPAELVVRVCEAMLAESSPTSRGQEVMFHGVPLRYVVMVNNDMGFERHMLLGRDWNCGFNLIVDHSAVLYKDEPLYDAFGARFVMRQVGMEGDDAFDRDMTVLRMTYADWRLDTQPPLTEE